MKRTYRSAIEKGRMKRGRRIIPVEKSTTIHIMPRFVGFRTETGPSLTLICLHRYKKSL
jgi:hypothetical protein